MKAIKTFILLVGTSEVFAVQAAGVPSEMFQPHGVQVIKSQAQSKGYHLVEYTIDREDADLKFHKNNHELDISIEDKDNSWIEIDQNLNTKRN